jgi:hypothetical protein
VASHKNQASFRRLLAHAPTWRNAAHNWLELAELAWEQVALLHQGRSPLSDTRTSDVQALKSLSLCKPYYFAAGMGLEILFKAVAILEVYRSVDGRDDRELPVKLPNQLRSHDLERLANRISLTVTDEQLQHLRRLSVAVQWHARYPVPTTAEGLDLAPEDGFPAKEDHPLTRALAAKAEDRYDEIVSEFDHSTQERYKGYLDLSL